MTPTIIISAPRSGTTWLLQALNAHPEVYATELRAFGEYVDLVQDQGTPKPRLRITLDRYVDALLQPHQWGPLGPSREVVGDELLRGIYATIYDHALARSGKRVFVDKLTPYLGTAARAVTSIARLFPDARVIMLVRDGRDVAVSGVMHWLTKHVVGDRGTDRQRQRRAFFLEHATESPERLFTDAELEEWASLWRQPIEAIRSPRFGSGSVSSFATKTWCATSASSSIGSVSSWALTPTRLIIKRCVDASTFEVMSGGRRRGDDAPGQHVRKGVVGDWRS